jgi:Tfp pilus assembly protein PilV
MAENRPVGTAGERGFTIIEGLVATAILLVVAIGVIPLFASAILNNSKGSDSTTASNFSKTNVENLLALPFTGPNMTITAGNKLEVDDWWKPGNGKINDPTQGWTLTAPSTTTIATWNRVTTIQQYQTEDILTDGALTTPLDTSVSSQAGLKMVTVSLASRKPGGILGNGERITVQMIRAF